MGWRAYDGGKLRGKRVVLPKYPTFFWLLAEYREAFREALPFRQDVWTNALMLFERMKNGEDCRGTCKMVSMHLRLSDYAAHLSILHSMKDITHTDYLTNVFKYVSGKYKVGK